MILYSIIPPEFVFGNITESDSPYVEIIYKGEKLLVSPLENNSFVINRIISTSPKSYLNPELQPGNIIRSGYAGGYPQKN